MPVKIGDVINFLVDDKLEHLVVNVVGSNECYVFNSRGMVGSIHYDDIKDDMIIFNIFENKGDE